MNILLVSSKYPPEYSGSGNRISLLYERLSKKYNSISPSVICNSTEYKNSNESYIYKNINVSRVSSNIINRKPGLFYKLLKLVDIYIEFFQTLIIISKKNIDLIHVIGTSVSTTTAIFWANLKNIPLLIELVNTGAKPNQNLPLLKYFYKPSLKSNTKIIAISEELKKTAEGFTDSELIWCRPNPIDEKKYNYRPEKKEIYRSEYTPFEMNDVILTSVAKFMPLKNQLFLIDVLNELPDQYKLILCGPLVKSGIHLNRDQDYLNQIKEKIKNKKLNKRVLLITEYIDASKYMKLSDIYMMPHHHEGLGTPMLESLACGTPVIANSSVSAFQQWIQHGINGYLCKLDIKDWLKAIKEITSISQDELLNNSEYLLNHYSTKKIDDEYWKIINSFN